MAKLVTQLTSSLQITWTGEFYDEQGDTYDDPTALNYSWGPSFRSSTLVDAIESANATLVFRTLRSQSNRAPGDREYLLPYGGVF